MSGSVRVSGSVQVRVGAGERVARMTDGPGGHSARNSSDRTAAPQPAP